jgi:hypothetical protein
MKRFLLIIFLASTLSLQAQTIMNNYKYIIVPERFSFLKKVNQYNLNALTKSLFEERGFTVYYDNLELPTEIASDKCKALTVDIEENNSMFSTNLTLLLKDCKGALVLKSKQGKSREKDYQASYNEALNAAFSSLPDLSKTPITGAQAISAAPQAESVKAVVITEPVKAVKEEASPATAKENKPSAAMLNPQANALGFDLLDATSKKIFTLLKTSLTDVFIANAINTRGIVFKKKGNWFYEYYKDGAVTTEQLYINFEK